MTISMFQKVAMYGLIFLGASLVGQGGYIKLKASLAEWLISSTWADRQSQQIPDKPWPWADTRVVARLSVPALGIRQFVMQDASGQSLAFGPGSVILDQPPGGPQYSLIAGHRDTHFKFLSKLAPGDFIQIDNYLGEFAQYRVIDTKVINVDKEDLYIDANSPNLTLVTCWPFDALIPGGPLRYLVNAQRVNETDKPDTALQAQHSDQHAGTIETQEVTALSSART